MSYSRQMQILYRADAFLIGYLNTACSLLDGSLDEHDAGELIWVCCMRTCLLRKKISSCGVWGKGSLCLGDKHSMLHRYVFFISNGGGNL